MAGPGVDFDKKTDIPRKGIEPTQVKTIKLLTDLDDGSGNDGSGTVKEKSGIVFGKTYTFKVENYTNGDPKDKSLIKWAVSYTDPETGKYYKNTLEDVVTGDTVNITFKNHNMCGTNLEIKAYINDLENEGKVNVFKHNRFRFFDGKIYLDGLASRRDDPSKIDQQATSLCGTAALLYFFAQNYKSEFFNSYKEFFRTGAGTINKFKLDPNLDLYEVKPIEDNSEYPHYAKYSDGTPCKPHILMHITDWIILAGTRSSDNKDYEGKNNENWDAINWCSYMVSAMQNLYGASSVEDKTSIFMGGVYSNTLIEIQKLYQEGWHVVLMIDSDMLDDSVSYIGCLTNYHWISYEGDLFFDTENNKYQFSYYCWHQLFKSASFRASVFNSNFYGYIKFKK